MMDLPEPLEWTILGFIGAGISIGVKLSREEKVNPWALMTTLATGAVAAGTCTEALVNFAKLEPFWAGTVALLLGLMAMGFVLNALDGKIPFINKFVGGGKSDGDNS